MSEEINYDRRRFLTRTYQTSSLPCLAGRLTIGTPDNKTKEGFDSSWRIIEP